jgi:hypothetical protein
VVLGRENIREQHGADSGHFVLASQEGAVVCALMRAADAASIGVIVVIRVILLWYVS